MHLMDAGWLLLVTKVLPFHVLLSQLGLLSNKSNVPLPRAVLPFIWLLVDFQINADAEEAVADGLVVVHVVVAG
jgi:hypothetical protein